MHPALHDARLPLDALAVALALSLWIACGSLVLAIANGLGEDPAARLAVGIALVASSALMLWWRDPLAAVMRARPWLVLPLAAGQLAAAAADGLIGGAYVAVTLTPIGIAVVVARARTVWLCVALLVTAYAVAVLVQRSPASLADGGDLGGVIGAMAAYPMAALVFLGLRGRFTRFVAAAPRLLEDIRNGAPAFTPALANAVQGLPVALPAPPPAKLTPSERRVVEGLASGRAPKQLAHAWGVSQLTVRTHIRNVKRKTGARTLPQVAALASRPGWGQTGAGAPHTAGPSVVSRPDRAEGGDGGR